MGHENASGKTQIHRRRVSTRHHPLNIIFEPIPSGRIGSRGGQPVRHGGRFENKHSQTEKEYFEPDHLYQGSKIQLFI